MKCMWILTMRNAVLIAITLLALGCSQGMHEGKAAEVDDMGNRHAVLKTTMGDIEIELYEDKAPRTTANFIKLAEQGFYDGLVFHRVIPDFMVQTGCPLGTGTGDPGYTIKDEFVDELKHDKPGVVSMANAGVADTGGSQFFITHKPTPWLDGKHAIFGQVVSGQDVVDAMGSVERDSRDKPKKDIVIDKVELIRP